MFAVVHATRGDTGDKVVTTCGGAQVMAGLARWQELGAFPILAKLAQSEKPTANGFYPMWWEPVTLQQNSAESE
jgi:hypothetical protein